MGSRLGVNIRENDTETKREKDRTRLVKQTGLIHKNRNREMEK